MHSLRLIYQSLILVALCHYGLCQNRLYEMTVPSVKVGNHPRVFENVKLVKYHGSGKIEFSENNELDQACGSFTAPQVEITDLLNDQIKFTIVRARKNRVLDVKCIFSFPSYVQTFFNDVRSHQSQDCGKRINVDKVFQYPKTGGGKLKQIRKVNKFYVKSMNSDFFLHSKTFNFVYENRGEETEPKLVFQALKYNVTSKIDTNKFVLCIREFPDHYFIIRFPDGFAAEDFHETARQFKDRKIICPLDWLTSEIINDLQK